MQPMPESRGSNRAWALLIVVVGIALAYTVPELPRQFVAYGRFTATRGRAANVIYMREGLTGFVAVSQDADGSRTYHNAGKPQASTHREDMRLQRMLGHLTTLVSEKRDKFMVIGLGAG